MIRFGAQNLSFNATYYNQHEWLEYSISKNSVYCFVGRNYSTELVLMIITKNFDSRWFQKLKECKLFFFLILYTYYYNINLL